MRLPLWLGVLHFTVLSVQATVTSFTDAWGGRVTGSIVGFEPSTGAGHPVYVWLAGTGVGWHNRSTDRDLLRRAAELGAVAGQCQYRNWMYPLGECAGMLSKAQPIFNITDPDSCLARLCARPMADCSRGVAVHGFSQGAQLSALAKNFAPQVSAALVQGHGDQPVGNLSSCMDYYDAQGRRNPYHGLEREQVRSLVGEHDTSFGCCFDQPDPKCCKNKKTARAQQIATTGYTCGSGEYSCLQTDGSGWYVVSDHDAGKSAGANHCFAWDGKCPALAGANDAWNPKWLSNDSWALDSSLSWLIGAARRFALNSTAIETV